MNSPSHWPNAIIRFATKTSTQVRRKSVLFFLLAVGVLGEATERNETPMDNSLKHIRALLESLLDGGEQEKCEKPQLGSCEIKENPIILFDKRTEEK